MANFAGLLKKTIDAQENPTPQLRARVYARARETVERKLAETNVSEEVAQAQLKALDDAIKSVEADYVAVERELLSTIMVKEPEGGQSSSLEAVFPGLKNNESEKLDEKTSPAGHPDDENDEHKEDIVPVGENAAKAELLAGRSGEWDNSGETDTSVQSGAPDVREETALSHHEEKSASTVEHLEGQRETFLHDHNEPAEETTPDGAQQDESSPSKTVPDAEPVNMEAIIAAEKEAQTEQLENEAQSAKALGNNEQNGDYNIVSDIFVQAARRTERQAARKRAIVVGLSIAAVVIIVVGVLFTAWSFLSSRNKSEDAENHIAEANKNEQPKEKFTQRLLADGSEVDEGPAKTEVKPGEGTSTSTGTAGVAVPQEQPGEATFYRARTDTEDEKVETGSVQWSLIKDKAAPGQPEEIAVRGNVTIPDEKLSLRLTLRRNTDPSLLAAYLIEAIFIVPDDFEGKAIDSVKELTFKDSEQSPGQQLDRTVEARIGDNFFLFALSDSNPFRDRNLRLMKQLGWMRFVITDKNNRIFELTFSKGAKGEAIFNEVIDTWLNQTNKPTLYDLQQQKSGQSGNEADKNSGNATAPEQDNAAGNGQTGENSPADDNAQPDKNGQPNINGQTGESGEQTPDAQIGSASQDQQNGEGANTQPAPDSGGHPPPEGNDTTDTDEEDTE